MWSFKFSFHLNSPAEGKWLILDLDLEAHSLLLLQIWSAVPFPNKYKITISKKKILEYLYLYHSWLCHVENWNYRNYEKQLQHVWSILGSSLLCSLEVDHHWKRITIFISILDLRIFLEYGNSVLSWQSKR